MRATDCRTLTGAPRILAGSDYPRISLERMVEALEKLDLTREEKAGIMSGNARRVLGGNAVTNN
jgi:uncharacterized protein